QGDPALRRRLDELLQAHAAAGDFLEGSAVAGQAKASGDQTKALDGKDAAAKTDHHFEFLQPSAKPYHLGRLAHYEILEILGQGGFGIVFKAFDEKLHRVVAIKVLGPQLATSGTARQRFLREARAAAAVRHQHVVDIHAIDELPLPYIVMEYVS